MLWYNIAYDRSSLEPTLILGLSGYGAEQPRRGIFIADPAAHARRASFTLVGSLLLHGLAAFAILEVGRAASPAADLPREVEVFMQFAGNEAAQAQASPEPPGLSEPTQPSVQGSPTAEPPSLPAAESLSQVAEPPSSLPHRCHRRRTCRPLNRSLCRMRSQLLDRHPRRRSQLRRHRNLHLRL